MSDKEIQLGGGFSTTTTSPRAGHHSPTTVAAAAVPSVEQCNTCGSMKRRSPSSSSSSLQEPTPKKLNFQPSPPTGPHDYPHGFNYLPLPILRPFVSNPFHSPVTNTNNVAAASNTQFPGSFSDWVPFLNPQSPEYAKIDVSSQSPSPTPSPAKATPSLFPPPLLRTLSDPTSSTYYQVPTTPPPPATKSTSSSMLPPLPPPLLRSQSDPTSFTNQINTTTPTPPPSSQEIGTDSVEGERATTSKRMKRMKEVIRGMSQLCDEVLSEAAEEEEDGSEVDHNNNPKDESETETQQAVSVERTGNCLIIHFKCPCSKGYQILFSGKNCYYKLV